jgi:hypothetical protein
MKRLKGKEKFIYIFSKAEAMPVRRIKAERRSGGTAPLVLNVGAVGRLVVNLMLRLLYRQSKSSRWVEHRAGLEVLETRKETRLFGAPYGNYRLFPVQ